MCPRGVKDNASASGAENSGSIPDGGIELGKQLPTSQEVFVMNSRYLMAVFIFWLSVGLVQVNSKAKNVDSLQVAFQETISKARASIDRYGATDSSMLAIQAALENLSKVPGLKGRADLKELHGSSSMGSAILATEGEGGITLFLARFFEGAATPVHDHLTWGVIRVLEGNDHYIHWERKDDGTDSGRVRLEKKFERILEPGNTVYWLGPPSDIHSQEAQNGEIWELVITGKDVTAEEVLNHRHYFDLQSGRVTVGKKK